MLPCQLVFETTCQLPIESDHKYLWALCKLNMNWEDISKSILDQLHELDDFLLKAYDKSLLYENKIKTWHDANIFKCKFCVGDDVILFNSRLKLFT